MINFLPTRNFHAINVCDLFLFTHSPNLLDCDASRPVQNVHALGGNGLFTTQKPQGNRGWRIFTRRLPKGRILWWWWWRPWWWCLGRWCKPIGILMRAQTWRWKCVYCYKTLVLFNCTLKRSIAALCILTLITPTFVRLGISLTQQNRIVLHSG